MDMLRVTAVWSGFTGGPGYSNFFFAGGGGLISDAQQVSDRVADAFSELGGYIPAGVSIRTAPEVAVIDSDTGMATGYHNVDQASASINAQGDNYAGPAGAVLTWRTDDVRFGRRIRGRTFIVPMTTASYEDDGTLSSNALGALRDFADHMTSWDFDSEFGVWSRPRDGEGGVFASVTSYSVPDRVSILRSRRD